MRSRLQTQHADWGAQTTLDQRHLLMHQVMLGDRRRLEAYDRALEQTIDPGDVVIDVGAGTLILSLLALRHGAGHVYAIEADPQVCAVARRIVAYNDLKDRITLIQGDARTVSLPEKGDVLVAEMMGYLGPEEEMAGIVRKVVRRHLRQGGKVVPQRLVTQLRALEFDEEGWGVWNEDFWGYSLNPVQKCARSTAQLHFFSRDPKPLSAPVVVADNRLGETVCEPGGTHMLDIDRLGELHAVIGYFTAELAPGITLSNFPSYPGCNWAVWTWPVRHTEVAPGAAIRIDIQRPEAVRVATNWRLNCHIIRNNEKVA